MRTQRRILVAVALAAFLGLNGCSTNQQGDDAVPVYLTVSFEDITSVQNIRTNDQDKLRVQQTVVANVLKVPGTASSMLDVRLESYEVRWQRVDGGTVVPSTEVFPANVVVPVGGRSSLAGYGYMSISQWQLPPISQLYPYNGGYDRETGRRDIRLRAIITFKGHTISGIPVESSPGNLDVEFVYQ